MPKSWAAQASGTGNQMSPPLTQRSTDNSGMDSINAGAQGLGRKETQHQLMMPLPLSLSVRSRGNSVSLYHSLAFLFLWLSPLSFCPRIANPSVWKSHYVLSGSLLFQLWILLAYFPFVVKCTILSLIQLLWKTLVEHMPVHSSVILSLRSPPPLATLYVSLPPPPEKIT